VGDALAEDVHRLAAGLLHQAGQLADMAEGVLERLLGQLGLLGQLVLGAARGGQLAGDLGQLLDVLANDLGLTADQRLHALEGELVGGGQRLDILALASDEALDVEGLAILPELAEVAEIPVVVGIELREIGELHARGLERILGLGHFTLPWKVCRVGCGLCCTATTERNIGTATGSVKRFFCSAAKFVTSLSAACQAAASADSDRT